MNRRSFVLGSLTAAASARVMGANDRMRIALAGPGVQGMGLVRDLKKFGPGAGAELVAVCELWTKRREAAAALAREGGGPEVRKLSHFDEILAMKDVDGVVIATPDHQHGKQLVKSIRARKDVFIEKPMANKLAEIKEAYRVVKGSDRVVQLGTQGLSNGQYQGVAAFLRSGKLGKVSRVSHEASFNGPRWRPIPDVKEIREADTDWSEWLGGHRRRPFDPQLYFEYRLYREFSDGIAAQWLTHAVAGVHHIMDDYFPESVVASGGVLVYPDGRESSDTLSVSLLYPKGFLFTYQAMFGNDYPGSTRYYGQNGTVERTDGRGYFARPVGGGSRPEKLAAEIPIVPIDPTNHVKNWLDCMRTRKTPNADVLSGYGHSVVATMTAQAEVSGKKLYWDRKREEITDRRPVS